jgi:hypothetical protein
MALDAEAAIILEAMEGLRVGDVWDSPEHAAAWAAAKIAALAQQPRPEQEAVPVAWVQKEVLAELARHKSATATVSSGLLTRPFGNPVALYATPAPAPAPVVYDEDRRVEVIERDVPVVWQRAAGGALEYALDMDTREIIGARIYLPPAPAPSAEVVEACCEIALKEADRLRKSLGFPITNPFDQNLQYMIAGRVDTAVDIARAIKALASPAPAKAAPASETEGNDG